MQSGDIVPVFRDDYGKSLNDLGTREFNYLILFYLRSQGFVTLASQLERFLIERSQLPTHLNLDGTALALTYGELFERAGPRSSLELLNKFLDIAYEHALYPNIKDDAVLGDFQFDISQNSRSNAGTSHHLPLYLPTELSRIRVITEPDATGIRNLAIVKLARQMGARCGDLQEHFLSHFQLMMLTQGHFMEIFFGIYDQTGHLIFTGGDDWLVKVWSADTGQLIQTFRGYKSQITGLSVDFTNQLLASCADGFCGAIRIWSLKSLNPVACILTHRDRENDPVIYFGWNNAFENPLLVAVWSDEIRTWRPCALEKNASDGVEPAAADAASIPKYGVDVKMLQGDTATHPHQSEFKCATLSPGGTRLVTGSKDGSIIFWRLDKMKIDQILVHSNASSSTTYTEIGNVVWSHSGNKIASTSEDGTIKIWQFAGPDSGWTVYRTIPISETKSSRLLVLNAIWSLDDQYVICSLKKVHQGSNLKVFDANAGHVSYSLSFHTDCVYVLDAHPRIPYIFLSAGYDGLVAIWDLRVGQSLKQFQAAPLNDETTIITDGHFSPDGSSFIILDMFGRISLYGIGPKDMYSVTWKEQFFPTDYAPTIIDSEGHVLDQTHLVEPHLLPRGTYCSCSRYPYQIYHFPPPLDLSYVHRQFASKEVLQMHSWVEAQENDGLTINSDISSSSVNSGRRLRAKTNEIAQPSGPRELRRQLDPDQTRSLRPLVPLRGIVVEDDILPGDLESNEETRSRRAAQLAADQEEDEEFEAEFDEDSSSDDEELMSSFIDDDLIYSNEENNYYEMSSSRFPHHGISTRLRRAHLQSYNENEMEFFHAQQMPTRRRVRYSAWMRQTKPSLAYIPQIDDEIVFFRVGYEQYCQSFPDFADSIPQIIPAICYCSIDKVEYKIRPFQHCVITLKTIAPQSSIPPLKTVFRSPQGTEVQIGTGFQKNGQTQIGSGSQDILVSRPFRSVALDPLPGGTEVLQNHRFSFSVRYRHSSKIPDFIVLATRFNQSVQHVWEPGTRFQAWLFNSNQTRGSWYSGSVVSVLLSSPWEALFVKWDVDDNKGYDGGQRMSPWEVEPLDSQSGERHRAWVETLNPQTSNAIADAFEMAGSSSPEMETFMRPVSLNKFPEYLDTITFPIDLSTIISRLRQMYYRSFAQLKFEVEMISVNAHLFDLEPNKTANNADVLVAKLKSILDIHEPECRIVMIRSSDSSAEMKSKKKRPVSLSDDDEKVDDDSENESRADSYNSESECDDNEDLDGFLSDSNEFPKNGGYKRILRPKSNRSSGRWQFPGRITRRTAHMLNLINGPDGDFSMSPSPVKGIRTTRSRVRCDHDNLEHQMSEISMDFHGGPKRASTHKNSKIQQELEEEMFELQQDEQNLFLRCNPTSRRTTRNSRTKSIDSLPMDNRLSSTGRRVPTRSMFTGNLQYPSKTPREHQEYQFNALQNGRKSTIKFVNCIDKRPKSKSKRARSSEKYEMNEFVVDDNEINTDDDYSYYNKLDNSSDYENYNHQNVDSPINDATSFSPPIKPYHTDSSPNNNNHTYLEKNYDQIDPTNESTDPNRRKRIRPLKTPPPSTTTHHLHPSEHTAKKRKK